VILVLASVRDAGAAALVTGWAGARLLTPSDLSLPGWALAAGPSSGAGPAAGRGIADGEPFATDDVTCVVSLLSAVDDADLTWLAPEHREYVASEMTAFLGYWLATLSDRCLVPPSYASLAGPCPPASAWASAAGLDLARSTAPGAPEPLRTAVTIVGGRLLTVAGGIGSPCVGPGVARRLRRMAVGYGAQLLTVVLEWAIDDPSPRLRAVLPAPLISTAPIRAAVRDLVGARSDVASHDELVAS
jgi:hypothetical protein